MTRVSARAIVAAVLLLAACTANTATISGDLDVALDVAAALEGVYAAGPKAKPATVANLVHLLAIAQAAVAAWKASGSDADEAAAGAAIAALVGYEATAIRSP
jgi:hypothetical protein